jgi:hypothetical protein
MLLNLFPFVVKDIIEATLGDITELSIKIGQVV